MKPSRWVGWLLRLFPAAFRDAHGAEIQEHVEQSLEGSSLVRPLAVVVAVADLFRAAVRLRVRPVGGRSAAGARWGWLGDTFQDARVATRGLMKNSGFSAVVILTLALGVGLNTALFSVVHTTILRPFDYDRPDELVYLAASFPTRDIDDAHFSGGDLRDLRAVQAFDAVEGLSIIRQNMNGAGLPRQVTVGWVSDGFLDLFGVEPALGRLHGPDEPPGMLVLGHDLWVAAFEGSPDVLGTSIQLDGFPYTVIGVMKQGFVAHVPTRDGAPPPVEVWKNPDSFWQNGDVWNAQGPEFAIIQAVARLSENVGIEDAQAGVDRVAADLRERFPAFDEDGFLISVSGLHEEVVQGVRPVLLMLLGAVGLVLLIACANVANLVMVRGQARRREIALRVALGSSRLRVGRYLMLESTAVAVAGTLAGVALAAVAVDVLPRLAPAGVPLADTIELDVTVLAFAASVTLFVTLLVGVLPTVAALRGDPGREIGTARAIGVRGAGVRRVLVVAQLALSLMLLVGAGLLTSSVARLQRVDPGFDPSDIYTFGVSVPGARYSFPEEASTFFREVESRVADLPGVEMAGVVWPMPFSGTWSGQYGMNEGEPRPLGDVQYRLATEAYFPTMSIPVVSGRLFRDGDDAQLIVVSEAVAERAWPGMPAIGRTLTANPWGRGPEEFEVIGVVGDVRYQSLRQVSEGALYFDARAWSWVDWEVHVVARTPVEATALLPSLRGVVAGIDPSIPLANPEPLELALRAQTADSRFILTLLGIFAATAGLLALVGLYGVVAYSVGLRRREFGVRIALGSARAGIRRIVLQEGSVLVVPGLVVGLAGAWALSAVLDAMLFEVSATDPVTYAAVALILAVCAFVASWIPAWRVGRVDPAEILRTD